MRDDYLGPAWGSNHSHVSAAIRAALSRARRSIEHGFERLHAYQFDAPWREPRRRRRA